MFFILSILVKQNIVFSKILYYLIAIRFDKNWTKVNKQIFDDPL